MSLLAHARIVMWEGGSLWVIDAVAPAERAHTEPHAHHAIQFTFTIGGTFGFRAGDLAVAGPAVLIAPDREHVFEANGLVAHLFVDSDSRDGRTIARTRLQGATLAAISESLLDGLTDKIATNFRASERNDAALVEIGRDLVNRLTGGVTGDAPDLRVRKMMAEAAARLDGPVSLSDLAGTGGLSASRLSHLFVEQTGLPFRTYLLWLRLSRALECVVAGEPLTSAAHEAGFADSAHFTRTFKRMFGVVPTALRMT